MFKYETHLHTSPVSACASVTVRETLEFYKSISYDGIFITNHFIDGNISFDHRDLPYEDKINFYFSDYEQALELSHEIGIKVFCGVEMSYGGSDFLVYGLDKQWYLAHPEIEHMKKSEELAFLRENGAFIIHAHPFREARYIDHIRLFPRGIDGVEVINANRTDFENRMARIYAENYGFLESAGSDNHTARVQKMLAGVCSDEPINSEADFIEFVKQGKFKIFSMPNPMC